MHQSGRYRCYYKRTGLDWDHVNNAGYGFWCPDWLAIFRRAYIRFSLVRVADLNSVLRANFGAYKNQRRAAFYFSTEFLGCAECECFAGEVSHCNFVMCVATKLAWAGACIPPEH